METNSTNLENRIDLILKCPFLSSLSRQNITELANLASEENFPANYLLVTQNEILNSIYLIEKGSLEVTIDNIPQCVLREGEMIGLSAIQIGKITTLTETKVISWDISVFHEFLQKYPSINQTMQDIAKKIYKMSLIKQAFPFTNFPANRIVEYIEQIKEKPFAEGTVIFKEGEIGDCCYLVHKGVVGIFIENEDGTERRLATLGPLTLFGEVALLTAKPRNASAKMLSDGDLFVFDLKLLSELMEHQDSVAESITLMAIERSRPTQQRNITAYHRYTPDGEKIVILKNTEKKRYFKLSEIGWFIWLQLDGKQTIQDVILALSSVHAIFSPNIVTDTIFNLANADFIDLPAIHIMGESEPDNVTKLEKLKRSFFKIIFKSYIFHEIDKWLTVSYKTFIHFFFTKSAKVFMIFLFITGLMAFFAFGPAVIEFLPQTQHPFILILLLMLAHIALVIVHELAHAYTTKSFGYEIHSAGFIFYWIGLTAYVDTSDMWLGNREQRILVNLAGPYVDMLIAGVASICAWYLANWQVKEFFWLLALLLYASVLKNLNPFNGGDGYYALADLLNYSKLRAVALTWLAKIQYKNMFNLDYLKQNKLPLSYWLSCMIFLLFNILFISLGFYYLQIILPNTLLGIPMAYLSWFIPLVVIVIFIVRLARQLYRN